MGVRSGGRKIPCGNFSIYYNVSAYCKVSALLAVSNKSKFAAGKFCTTALRVSGDHSLGSPREPRPLSTLSVSPRETETTLFYIGFILRYLCGVSPYFALKRREK